MDGMSTTGKRTPDRITTILLLILSVLSASLAYQPGDEVPISKMGQYHCSRTMWPDMIARRRPIFGFNSEVLVGIADPKGYTGADPYKISFQVGREKIQTPWLFLINRESPEVPMIDVHLRYKGGDLQGVTAQVVDMPHYYVDIYLILVDQYWDPRHWPKHVLLRYNWEEDSDDYVTTAAGFDVKRKTVSTTVHELLHAWLRLKFGTPCITAAAGEGA